MKKKSFIGQLQEEISRIRKELGCTEAEAYFTLRTIANPPECDIEDVWERDGFIVNFYKSTPPDSPEGSRKWVLSYVQDFMTRLEQFRKRAEKGSFSYFLVALAECGSMGFPLPDWITARIHDAHVAYSGHKEETLDGAFGAKRPPHYHQGKAREMVDKYRDVFIRCEQLRNGKEKVKIGAADGGLFERVAKEMRPQFMDLKESKVRDIYYMVRNAIPSSGYDLHLELCDYKPKPSARKREKQQMR